VRPASGPSPRADVLERQLCRTDAQIRAARRERDEAAIRLRGGIEAAERPERASRGFDSVGVIGQLLADRERIAGPP
jgi:hypothetical protein